MAPVGFLKQVVQEFGLDKVGQLSAAFAYTAVFSLGPLLLVVISVIGLAFGEEAASGRLFSSLSGVVGAETAKTLQDVVDNLHKSGGGVIALIAGILGMLLAAAALTTQLQNAFDVIFNVRPDPKGGLKRTIFVKLKNVFIIIAGSLTVAASVAVSTVITGLGNRVGNTIGVPAIVLEPANTLASLAVFTLILYGAYRVLPNVKVPRRPALVAGLVIALLFVVGKFILAIIIGNNGTASAYGAAASLITLLLWVYYSGQILFLGAEGLKVHAFNRGIIYPPKKHSLKQEPVGISGDGLSNRVVESFSRGLKKGVAKQSGKKSKK